MAVAGIFDVVGVCVCAADWLLVSVVIVAIFDLLILSVFDEQLALALFLFSGLFLILPRNLV